MKKCKVVVQHLAKEDIREARKWYNNQLPGLGKRLTADMVTTLRKVSRNPKSFAVRYKTIRLANFDTFPYAAHFYIDKATDTVFIVAIMHTSRHPAIAKSR
jgi:plasmid stabilization system protein ParE